jgi:hypothetical protein
VSSKIFLIVPSHFMIKKMEKIRKITLCKINNKSLQNIPNKCNKRRNKIFFKVKENKIVIKRRILVKTKKSKETFKDYKRHIVLKNKSWKKLKIKNKKLNLFFQRVLLRQIKKKASIIRTFLMRKRNFSLNVEI